MVDLKSYASSQDPQTKLGYLIVYGVEGTHSNVPSSVYSQGIVEKDGEISFNKKINMNNKKK